MSDANQHLDPTFVESKRRELTKLRDSLRSTANSAELEEGNLKAAAAAQPREFEDDAQKLDTLEKEGTLVNRSVKRLSLIERALAKIEAGTYGLSDISGDRIPTERLNAVPEATTTIKEQEASERTG